MRASQKELLILEKITKPCLKINSQMDRVQIQEIEDHCYASLEWETNTNYSKSKEYMRLSVLKGTLGNFQESKNDSLNSYC